jgi:pilus assembly protein CpaB
MSRVLGRPLDTRTVALSVAGLLAVGTGVLTFNYLGSVNHAAPASSQRIVLVAAKTIPAHATITAEMLGRASRPADAVDPDALAAPSAALGSVAMNEIPAGSLLTSSKLAHAAASGLVGHMHAGMRAVSIALDRVKGVSNLIQAGDRVDVIAVTPARNDEAPKAATIIRGAQVLSIGQMLDAQATPSPDGQQYATATLEVTPKQADLLALADINTTLRLALRSPRENLRSQPTEAISLAPPGKPVSAPQIAPPVAAPKPAPLAAAPAAPAALTPKPRPTSPVVVIDGDSTYHPNI